jgi:hypothetical protein
MHNTPFLHPHAPCMHNTPLFLPWCPEHPRAPPQAASPAAGLPSPAAALSHQPAFSKRRRFILYASMHQSEKILQRYQGQNSQLALFCFWLCIQYKMFGTGSLDYLYHIFVNYCCFVVEITTQI